MKDPSCIPELHEGFRKYFPDSRLVEPAETSHFLQEDEPDTIVREMNHFLSE